MAAHDSNQFGSSSGISSFSLKGLWLDLIIQLCALCNTAAAHQKSLVNLHKNVSEKANFLHGGCKKKMYTHNCWFFQSETKNHHRMCHCVASRNYQPWKIFLENCCHWSNFIFSGFVCLFFEALKEHWAFIPRIGQRKLWGLDFYLLDAV